MSFDAWDLLSLYRRLPSWFRLAAGVAIFAFAIAICWHGQRRVTDAETEARRTNKPVDPLIERQAQGVFRAGLSLSGIGVVVVATSGRSRSEENGYNF